MFLRTTCIISKLELEYRFRFTFCFLLSPPASKEINLESVLINHLCEVKMCIKWFHGQAIRRVQLRQINAS